MSLVACCSQEHPPCWGSDLKRVLGLLIRKSGVAALRSILLCSLIVHEEDTAWTPVLAHYTDRTMLQSSGEAVVVQSRFWSGIHTYHQKAVHFPRLM